MRKYYWRWAWRGDEVDAEMMGAGENGENRY